jgi:tyrosinase
MISRRHFLQASLSVALVSLLPRSAFTATTLQVRPSWTSFRTGPLFPVFTGTIGAMKANKNSSDPASWLYWASVHKRLCVHGLPYFLAWHHGFLKRFEGQLRKMSGYSDLVLPYWDYYADPALPVEFTDDTSPLWRRDRTGNDVRQALTLAPFADTIIHFPRGKTYAFEPTLEAAPHNPVHNLIGGVMGDLLLSPLDPIFWLHHANIDRLWAAWVKAGDGRRMPATTNAYWSGVFNYGPGVASMDRVKTYTTRGLGYRYDNETMPAQLPPLLAASSSFQAASYRADALPPRPPAIHSVSLDSGQPMSLDQRSVSVDVPLTAQDRQRVRSLLMQKGAKGAPAGSIRVVLDGIRLTELGKKGGYFFKVYINLPEQPGLSVPESNYLLGMLGPFEIEGAGMRQMRKHGGMQMEHAGGGDVRMVFPVTEALRKLWPASLDKLTISFVRANGGTPVDGTVIVIKQFRMETSDTAPR